MFKDSGSTADHDTVIGHSVKVEGDFVTEGNIIIDGIICGNIKTSKSLKVGPKSKIYANVSADSALIAGEVQGNVRVTHQLELTATAKIFGDIRVGTLVVAAGSLINGRCQMGETKDKSPKPDFAKQKKIELKTVGTQIDS
jgi:cytoskeletal protein CcmA (bactofilin family)